MGAVVYSFSVYSLFFGEPVYAVIRDAYDGNTSRRMQPSQMKTVRVGCEVHITLASRFNIFFESTSLGPSTSVSSNKVLPFRFASRNFSLETP